MDFCPTITLFLMATIVIISAQHAYEPLAYAHPSLANPSVVDASIVESHLPKEHMRAIHFYRNPKTAEALAKSSWFTDKEMPVIEREADKIPREQVYKLFKNAGFLEH